eukprot:gb/GECH01011414.1/.p1 GENE.gb/GECH01011414.1/~~gb/GECH01011414.1/.p1  ORF type:complete len:121 (+),score=24.92 gb/GECH01011414.1/:1-363(+)
MMNIRKEISIIYVSFVFLILFGLFSLSSQEEEEQGPLDILTQNLNALRQDYLDLAWSWHPSNPDNIITTTEVEAITSVHQYNETITAYEEVKPILNSELEILETIVDHARSLANQTIETE